MFGAGIVDFLIGLGRGVLTAAATVLAAFVSDFDYTVFGAVGVLVSAGLGILVNFLKDRFPQVFPETA